MTSNSDDTPSSRRSSRKSRKRNGSTKSRRRGIEKGFTRASQSLKQELMEASVGGLSDNQRKRTIQATCMERREKARQAHSAAIESSRDILRETLTQVKEVGTFKASHLVAPIL